MSDCFDVEQINEAGKKMSPGRKRGMCDGNHDVQVPSLSLWRCQEVVSW